MRKWKEDSGQVLLVTAGGMMMMMGFVGFAADVGQLFHAKRNLQAAVDAAAIAATVTIQKEQATTLTMDAQNSATAALAANGVTGVTVVLAQPSDPTALTSPTVYLSSPPADGPNAGRSQYVEAELTTQQTTMFLALFNKRTVNVTTRAVAGVSQRINQSCINVLNLTASQAMYLYGNFTVDAPGCGISVNSNSSDALDFGGATGTLTAGWVQVNGGDGGHTGDSSPAPVVNSGAVVTDPYMNMTWPSTSNGGCSNSGLAWSSPPFSGTTYGTTSAITVIGGTNNNAPTGTGTNQYNATTGEFMGPGAGNTICFSSAVTFDGSGANGLELGPGIYVFMNGLTITTNSSLYSQFDATTDTGGTTLVIDNGSMSLPTSGVNFCQPGQTCLNNDGTGLVAPTSGQTAGFVIAEPPPNSNQLLYDKGTDTGNISGTIYAPDANLYLHDNAGSLSMYGQLYVNTLQDQASTLDLHSPPTFYDQFLPHVVTLVE